MGSPAIAVPTLDALAACCDVSLAVTQPNRPKGRGLHVVPTAVHARADELGIPVLATQDVNSPEAVSLIKSAAPEAIVVVSFGQMLRKPLLHAAPLGCLNVHFSLLPELRGAAPVAWALIRCHESTGVSVMRMVRKMDAGAVYAQREAPIRPDDTSQTLSARLAAMGAEILVGTLPAICAGRIVPLSQDESLATFAPKITRETGKVDWQRGGREVDCLIRGLSGQLEAYSFLDRQPPVRVTIYNCAPWDGPTPGAGVIARGPAGQLLAGCGDGMVEIKEIQAEGRKRVSGRDFANGYHLHGGGAERFIHV